MAGLPNQHYLPVAAHYKISKLVTKVGFRLRPSGPNAFSKIGGKGKGKSKSASRTRGSASKGKR